MFVPSRFGGDGDLVWCWFKACLLFLFRNEYKMNSSATGRALVENSNRLNTQQKGEGKSKWSSQSVRLKARGSTQE